MTLEELEKYGNCLSKLKDILEKYMLKKITETEAKNEVIKLVKASNFLNKEFILNEIEKKRLAGSIFFLKNYISSQKNELYTLYALLEDEIENNQVICDYLDLVEILFEEEEISNKDFDFALSIKTINKIYCIYFDNCEEFNDIIRDCLKNKKYIYCIEKKIKEILIEEEREKEVKEQEKIIEDNRR